MVVCVPNPSLDEKNPNTPVPMLIRVKTAEDADELQKILQEKKAWAAVDEPFLLLDPLFPVMYVYGLHSKMCHTPMLNLV